MEFSELRRPIARDFQWTGRLVGTAEKGLRGLLISMFEERA